MRCDRVWINARLATLAPDREGLGVVERGLVASLDGQIAYAGPAGEAPAFETAELVTVGASLLALSANLIHVAQQFDQLRGPIAHVDTLVLPVHVNIVELSQHPQQRHVRSRIVDHPF